MFGHLRRWHLHPHLQPEPRLHPAEGDSPLSDPRVSPAPRRLLEGGRLQDAQGGPEGDARSSCEEGGDGISSVLAQVMARWNVCRSCEMCEIKTYLKALECDE